MRDAKEMGAKAREKKEKKDKKDRKEKRKGKEANGASGSEEEEEVEWMTDVSAEAIKKRAAEQLTAATASLVTVVRGWVPFGGLFVGAVIAPGAVLDAVAEKLGMTLMP